MSYEATKMEDCVDQRAEEIEERATDLPLQNFWTFWYDEKASKGMEHGSYASALKQLGEFGSVQEFWRYMNHIDVNNLPVGSNLRLFKRGIEPTWEDPANQNGGKYVFEIPHGVVVKDIWTYTLLALVGETFESPESICGAVLSIRPRNLSTINIWNSSSFQPEVIARGEDDIHRLIVANLAANRRSPVSLKLHYQPHQKSLDWNQLWTTTKSKEQVLAQLAVSSDTAATKKTLTSSPNTSRRSKLSVDQATGSNGHKQSLRSSTGSMQLINSTSRDSTKASTIATVPARNGSHPNLGTPHLLHSETRKSTGSIQRSGAKPSNSDSSPRGLSPSSSSSPSDPNPLKAGVSYRLGDPLMEHDSNAASVECDDSDDMRSPFLELSSPPRIPTMQIQLPYGFQQLQIPSIAKGPSTHITRPAAPHSLGPSETGSLSRSLQPQYHHSSSEWASMSSLTGEGDSEPSPRQLFTSSSSSADVAADAALTFAAVLQEVQNPQQWWLHRGYRRRGRPDHSSGDSQLRVPEAGEHSSTSTLAITSMGSSPSNWAGNTGAKPRSPNSSDTSNPLISPSGAPTSSEKRKRKRPSRGGSRDKTRSKETSPAITPSATPSPSFSSTPPPNGSTSSSSALGALQKADETGMDLGASYSSNATSESDPVNLLHDDSYGTPLLKSRSPSVVELILESDFEPTSSRTPSDSSDSSSPNPPSVVIVSSDQDGDAKSQTIQSGLPVKHHRKRSRGRGGSSRSKSDSSRPTPASSSLAERLKSIGMICIIVLLMVLCYLLGRMSGGGYASSDIASPATAQGSTSLHNPPAQTMAQPRLARQHL